MVWLMETPSWAANCGSSALQKLVQHLRDHGTFKPQNHDRGRDRTERILQAEEQILERVEEEPDTSKLGLAAKVAVSHFLGSCSYFCSNKQCGIVVARTKHPSE